MAQYWLTYGTTATRTVLVRVEPNRLLQATASYGTPYETTDPAEISALDEAVARSGGVFENRAGSTTWTNLVTNPSLETNNTGWSYATNTYLTTVIRSTEWANAGSYSLKFAGDTTGAPSRQNIIQQPTGSLIAVTPGMTVSASVRTNLTAIAGSGAYIGFKVSWLDISLNGLGQVDVDTSNRATAVGVKEQRIENAVAPANAKWAQLTVVMNNGTGMTYAGYLDSFMLVEGALPPVYFDGDSAFCSWNGTAHNSTSKKPT